MIDGNYSKYGVKPIKLKHDIEKKITIGLGERFNNALIGKLTEPLKKGAIASCTIIINGFQYDYYNWQSEESRSVGKFVLFHKGENNKTIPFDITKKPCTFLVKLMLNDSDIDKCKDIEYSLDVIFSE
jgi:hypothetical protein